MNPTRQVIFALQEGRGVVVQPRPMGPLVVPVSGSAAIDILELGTRVEQWCVANCHRPEAKPRHLG